MNDNQLDATTRGPQVPAYCEPDTEWERYTRRHRAEVLALMVRLYEVGRDYDANNGGESPVSPPGDWMDEFRITWDDVKSAAAGR